MTTSMHKTLAVLKLPASVPALVSLTRAILAAMTGNPSFPGAAPLLQATAAALAALSSAEVAAQTRTRGTIAVRDERRAALVTSLAQLRSYVQSVVDGQGPESAAGLIESAGMRVRSQVAPSRPAFEVRAGVLPGTAQVVVRSAGDRAAYQWAWSGDSGATWRDGPHTLRVRAVLSGLPSVSLCSFRYRVVTKVGEGDWSETLQAVVR